MLKPVQEDKPRGLLKARRFTAESIRFLYTVGKTNKGAGRRLGS
jgi:hypothetical protein